MPWGDYFRDALTQQLQPYLGKLPIAKDRLDLLHSDLSGIISPPSLGGNWNPIL